MIDTDTCARCTLTIGYDCGCTEIERLTAERDTYKSRAKQAEGALSGVAANSTDKKARFIATEALAQIDAQAALKVRDRQIREEAYTQGVKEAARLFREHGDTDVVLALIEKDKADD